MEAVAGKAAVLLKIAAVVPLFISIADQAIDFYRKHTSNGPQARYEALKKWREANSSAHKTAMQDLENLEKSMEESARKNDEMMRKHFENVKIENEKSFQEMSKSIEESDKKYEDKMSKIQEEHRLKMEEMKAESRAGRKELEEEHEELMRKLEEEHKEEKGKAEEKLENIRKEGVRLVAEAEKELERVEKEQRENMDLICSEKLKLVKEFEERERILRKENSDLKTENIRDRIKHIEEQSEVTIKQIEDRTNDLLNYCRQEASKAMVRSFRKVYESFCRINNSLANIGVHCIEGDVAPGILTADFDSIGVQKALYVNDVNVYRQTALNAQNADQIVHNTLSNILSGVENLLSSDQLAAICAHLPTALNQEKSEKIIKYGLIAKTLSIEFNELRSDVETKMNQLTISNFQKTITD